jgi:RimJ/RimL family protein N-acetyltransferase
LNIELIKASDDHLKVLFEGRTIEDDRLMGFYPGEIDDWSSFKHYHRMGMAILKDGQTAGCIDYYNRELGWWVLPVFRKQGVATLALRQFIQSRYGIDDEIRAASYTHNTASLRLMKSLGFQFIYERNCEAGKHLHVHSKKLNTLELALSS